MKAEIFEKGKLSTESTNVENLRKVRFTLNNGTEFTISENRFGELEINKSDSAIIIEPYMSNEIIIK